MRDLLVRDTVPDDPPELVYISELEGLDDEVPIAPHRSASVSVSQTELPTIALPVSQELLALSRVAASGTRSGGVDSVAPPPLPQLPRSTRKRFGAGLLLATFGFGVIVGAASFGIGFVLQRNGGPSGLRTLVASSVDCLQEEFEHDAAR